MMKLVKHGGGKGLASTTLGLISISIASARRNSLPPWTISNLNNNTLRVSGVLSKVFEPLGLSS